MTGTIEELPPYRRQKGDRNLAATIAISRLSFRLLRHPDLESLDIARREAEAWAATMPDLDHSDAQLLAWIHTYPPRLGTSMRRLLESSMLGAAPAPSSSSSWTTRGRGPREPDRRRHR